ncbi:DUF3678 domain-containing protein [[Clostridium] scindens]|uniref:DUF3678 domain-containing protein n=1 Tax=Clostridium scindens (strain JCM 10418 / VPI 12708) TaxID=29347 RepID=A0A844FB56_CLOSV|nr:DUF3678 domain-containing protein [[Clostridium] scindens]
MVRALKYASDCRKLSGIFAIVSAGTGRVITSSSIPSSLQNLTIFLKYASAAGRICPSSQGTLLKVPLSAPSALS